MRAKLGRRSRLVLAVAAIGAGSASAAATIGATTPPPTPLTVTGIAAPSAPRAGSFLSVWPECACGTHAVLEQFSLTDGRRLRALARVPAGTATHISDPHANPGGPVWLTFQTGPRYGGHVAGGDPMANTCSGDVVRYDPAGRRATTVAVFPRNVLVSDTVPAPRGRRVAMLAGGCATSFFDMHIVIEDLRTGHPWTVGADARRCHALSEPGWSADGSRLVFAYGPSTLGSHGHLPQGVCTPPRHGRVVIVASSRASRSSSWIQTLPDRTCSYVAAAFDRAGVAAVEACSKRAPAGSGGETNLGDAYLVQLDALRHATRRLALKRGWDGGGIASDPRTGGVLVSESPANNNGGSSHNWAWSFDGRRLRVISRYPGADATIVVAEPW